MCEEIGTGKNVSAGYPHATIFQQNEELKNCKHVHGLVEYWKVYLSKQENIMYFT